MGTQMSCPMLFWSPRRKHVIFDAKEVHLNFVCESWKMEFRRRKAEKKSKADIRNINKSRNLLQKRLKVVGSIDLARQSEEIVKNMKTSISQSKAFLQLRAKASKISPSKIRRRRHKEGQRAGEGSVRIFGFRIDWVYSEG